MCSKPKNKAMQLGHRSRCPNVDFGNGLLLVIADAAAQIADPGCQANLRDRRLVSTWPWKHVAVPYALNGNVDDAKTARAEASPFVSGVRFGVSSDRFPPKAPLRDGTQAFEFYHSSTARPTRACR
jgi:hypothetical protein